MSASKKTAVNVQVKTIFLIVLNCLKIRNSTFYIRIATSPWREGFAPARKFHQFLFFYQARCFNRAHFQLSWEPEAGYWIPDFPVKSPFSCWAGGENTLKSLTSHEAETSIHRRKAQHRAEESCACFTIGIKLCAWQLCYLREIMVRSHVIATLTHNI